MSNPPLNQYELQRVIERAREIDARDQSELTRLHAIASQLNISPAAMEQALAEVARAKEAAEITATLRTPPRRSTLRAWLAAATVGIGSLSGYAAGMNYQPPGGDSLTEFTVITLIGLSVSLVWSYRKDARPWGLFGRMAVLWASYGYGWAVGHGQLPEWAYEFTIIGGAISVAAGGALHQAYRLWQRLRRSDVDMAPNTGDLSTGERYASPASRYLSKGSDKFSTPLPPHFSTPI
jgi:hypothetical protein